MGDNYLRCLMAVQYRTGSWCAIKEGVDRQDRLVDVDGTRLRIV